MLISWKNPTTPFDYIRIYRSKTYFTYTSDATLIAEIHDRVESYLDDEELELVLHYYSVCVVIDDNEIMSNVISKKPTDLWSPEKILDDNNRSGGFFDFTDKSTLIGTLYGRPMGDDNQIRAVFDKSHNRWDMGLSLELNARIAKFFDGTKYGLLFTDDGLGLTSNPQQKTSPSKGAHVFIAMKSPKAFGSSNSGYNMASTVLSSWESGTGNDFVFGFGDNKLALYIEPNMTSTMFSTPTIPTSTNMVIAASTNTSGTKIYYNEEVVYTTTTYSLTPRIDGIGGYYNGNYVSALKNNAQIYAVLIVFDTLTQPEINLINSWMRNILPKTSGYLALAVACWGTNTQPALDVTNTTHESWNDNFNSTKDLMAYVRAYNTTGSITTSAVAAKNIDVNVVGSRFELVVVAGTYLDNYGTMDIEFMDYANVVYAAIRITKGTTGFGANFEMGTSLTTLSVVPSTGTHVTVNGYLDVTDSTITYTPKDPQAATKYNTHSLNIDMSKVKRLKISNLAARQTHSTAASGSPTGSAAYIYLKLL